MRRNITNRADRDEAARLLERWLSGTITNYEIDDAWPWNSEDAAVVDIGRETWRYYSDFPEQPLSTGSMSGERKAVLLRCVSFLHTNEPYLLPEGVGVTWGPLRKFFGRFLKREEIDLMSTERKLWWPFADELHYSRGRQE